MQELFVTAADVAVATRPRRKGAAAPRMPWYMRDEERKAGLTGQPLWDALDKMEARLRAGRPN
jgi:hypothetical protein